ncbi:MAG: signal peptidase I [Dehalococcoidales bacterium]|nr:MAG: signal peptidase I [Dehalococcoidales bacterium]
MLTDSMAPLIHPGDQIMVSKVPAEQVRSGDIIVFSRNGELIVHRVLKIRLTNSGIRFVEKGDSSGVCGLFSSDDVIGRVTMVKGKGKIFNLNSPLSRLTSRALSVWPYWTSAIATRLRASSNKNLRRAGRVLLRLLLLSSNVLIRICCVVWYVSGMKYRKNAESN